MPEIATSAPADTVLRIFLNERWVTCCMCGEEADHTEPSDRRCVPIWNGEPTSSKATRVDGYGPVCGSCYCTWDQWDDGLLASTSTVVVGPA